MRGLAAAIALLVVAPALALAQFRGPRAELTPLVESDVRAGATTRAAVEVRLPQQLHVQSNAPRDPALIATELTFNTPAGIRATEIVFPKPTDLQQAGLPQPLAVFEHEFAIGVQFAVDQGTAPGTVEVPGHLRYQACDDKVCYPPQTGEVRWTLTVVESAARTTPTRPDVFERIPFGTGVAPAAAAAATAPARTAPAAGSDGIDQLKDFALVSSTGYANVDEFLTFLKNAETGVKEKGLFEGRGPLAILLLIFLGGLALNLTPCVLPMIPINLAIIGAGAKAGSRGRGFLLGGVYGAAMAVVYGVLGVVVITTASTFGTINASPWFNVAIALVFIVLALAMFDVLTIDFSRFAGSVGNNSAKGSVALAFGMGAIAALLAGACVAPVVIQVILFSSGLYAQGTLVALALPFLLGVGMAVPWPLAGAGLTALPKPGPWMVRVKQAFGVFILATASYYGYLAYGLFADRWVDPKEVAASVQEKLKSGWHSSLAEGLNVALLEQKPVLIDMWATWCKNCVVMDRTTLADPAVTQALDRYVKIKYQAEQLDEYPARALVERFKVVGLPTYIVLHPKRAPNFNPSE